MVINKIYSAMEVENETLQSVLKNKPSEKIGLYCTNDLEN